MLTRLTLILFWIALAGVWAVTLAGATAPWLLITDIVNHFRPFWLAAACAVVALAWPARSSLVGKAAACVALVINAALAVAPMLWTAPAATRTDLKILTFNLWVGNKTPRSVVQYVKTSGADVVVLEEVDGRLEKAIVPALAAEYPHVVSCAQRNCGLVLLSKAEWVSSGSSDRRPGAPSMVWASFPEITVTGVHLAFPFQPIWQDAQTAFLAHKFASSVRPEIVVGDFNLTPYSWKLNRLSLQSGLLRHATLGASWPANRVTPVVLLDNLLASPSVGSAGVSIGPSGLGSDHRPLLFRLSVGAKQP